MNERPSNFNESVRLHGDRRLLSEENALVCPTCGAHNRRPWVRDVERIASNCAFCKACSHSGPIADFLKEERP